MTGIGGWYIPHSGMDYHMVGWQVDEDGYQDDNENGYQGGDRDEHEDGSEDESCSHLNMVMRMRMVLVSMRKRERV